MEVERMNSETVHRCTWECHEPTNSLWPEFVWVDHHISLCPWGRWIVTVDQVWMMGWWSHWEESGFSPPSPPRQTECQLKHQGEMSESMARMPDSVGLIKYRMSARMLFSMPDEMPDNTSCKMSEYTRHSGMLRKKYFVFGRMECGGVLLDI